jgi:phosphoribosylanthranilate isomerase
MTRIKVCGITNREDAEFACRCGVDAIGFVFADSPRQVTPERARDILRGLEPFVVRVGVFVNRPVEEVRRVLEFTGCSVAQLHGEEGPEYVEALAPFGVVKAIRVSCRAGMSAPQATHARRILGAAETARPYRTAKAILLDTAVPGKAGGTGRRFDVGVAAELVKAGYRVIVAGGLTPENVGEVVKTVRPYGVDVSSGVEAEPGRKDHQQVARFVEAVRVAGQEIAS